MARYPNSLSRRNLLGARPLTGSSPDEHHISSLVIHSRPERLPLVLAALRRMPGVEIHGDTASGKVVITLETKSEHEVVQRMGEIGELTGVLSTALVYHHFE